MTDAERQKLCKELSRLNVYSDAPKRAAEELERLAKEVARLKDEHGVLSERITNMLDMTVR